MAAVNFGRSRQIWRFYQAAALNTVFGYSFFAVLICIGVQLFLAQAIAFACGVAFNYVVYSRHAFRGSKPAKLRFVAAYSINYLNNVGMLAIFSGLVRSHYLAGALASFGASLINFVVLKRAVFRRKAT